MYLEKKETICIDELAEVYGSILCGEKHFYDIGFGYYLQSGSSLRKEQKDWLKGDRCKHFLFDKKTVYLLVDGEGDPIGLLNFHELVELLKEYIIETCEKCEQKVCDNQVIQSPDWPCNECRGE